MDHGDRKGDSGNLQEVAVSDAETRPARKGKVTKSAGKASFVRFSDEEHLAIQKLALEHGESIPELLKKCFFGNPPKQPIVSDENARAIMIGLNRIGNNLNQIARKVNTGFREGFISAFDEVRDDLRALKNFAVGLSGDSQT